MNIFETAARNKIRFQSPMGLLSVEELFDLPLQSKSNRDLDTVAKHIARELKSVTEESFVSTASNPAKTENELKLEIVKYVIGVKQAEAAAANEAATKADKKRKLVALLAEKQENELRNLSTEDILKQLAELG